ncbi:hypothetical protein AQUCO_01100319v1 [Aquilegia coerulea]|uniref:Uncharacterized protein n=1 Tax=Aquilegia coerulea TaxID=218851 RepID=A0A2G5E6L3_AQUCA|nr:hypothetical protein AQUCO_01100319v1 [Aquilegia coerulea]
MPKRKFRVEYILANGSSSATFKERMNLEECLEQKLQEDIQNLKVKEILDKLIQEGLEAINSLSAEEAFTFRTFRDNKQKEIQERNQRPKID